jgi:hypothetical protein
MIYEIAPNVPKDFYKALELLCLRPCKILIFGLCAMDVGAMVSQGDFSLWRNCGGNLAF